jgi:hypothetical protein
MERRERERQQELTRRERGDLGSAEPATTGEHPQPPVDPAR